MPHHISQVVPDLPGGPLLRDALRILRHVALEGRAALRQGSDQIGAPLQQIAGAAIQGMDHVATGAERAAHLVLGDIGRLDGTAPRDAAAFARAAYAALRHILPQLGAAGWLLSEVKLALAFDGAAFDAMREQQDLAHAAMLVVAMQGKGVIAELRMAPAATLSQGDAAALAPFALMLWMLAEKSPQDAADTLSAATALTLALRAEIAAAAGDPAAIAALLAEFRHHV